MKVLARDLDTPGRSVPLHFEQVKKWRIYCCMSYGSSTHSAHRCECCLPSRQLRHHEVPSIAYLNFKSPPDAQQRVPATAKSRNENLAPTLPAASAATDCSRMRLRHLAPAAHSKRRLSTPSNAAAHSGRKSAQGVSYTRTYDDCLVWKRSGLF